MSADGLWILKGGREFRPAPFCVYGIVNVTPDSFYDGGQHETTEAAVQHGRRLVDDGAHILDIGAESSRPYAAPVSLEEEQNVFVGETLQKGDSRQGLGTLTMRLGGCLPEWRKHYATAFPTSAHGTGRRPNAHCETGCTCEVRNAHPCRITSTRRLPPMRNNNANMARR